MRRRYFVRVVQPFAIFRAEHEIALEKEEFDRVKGKGLVTVLHEEHDGARVEVDRDEGAAPAPAATPSTRGDELLDTITDEERKLLLDRRAKSAAKVAKAEDKPKG